MNIVLTVINKNLDLESQKILVYLKPQTNNSDWVSAAWQACSPQSNGGSHVLDAITNEVSAYISFDNERSKSALQKIEPQYISTVIQSGNELILGSPELDSTNLTEHQCGVKNQTTLANVYPVWCLNGKSICKTVNPMFNGGFSTFELIQKAFFTIGSSISTDTFDVQNWDELTGIDLPAGLVSADIIVELDKITNKITYTISNQVYA